MAAAPPQPAPSVDEIVALAAKAGEPDRYIAALLAPAALQPALMTIAAFGAEIARIPAEVSQPMLGQIRLQWWRDTLDAPPSTPETGAPLADRLRQTAQTHNLPRALFERLIDAREHDLSGHLLPNDDAMANYLEATEGALFRLALTVLERGRPDLPAQAAVAPAARAYGLARALLRLPASLHNGGFIIPETRLGAAGIAEDALVARPLAPATDTTCRALVAQLCDEARLALRQAQGFLADADPRNCAAFHPLVMVEPYLGLQKRQGFVPLTMLAEVSPVVRPIRIGLSHFRSAIRQLARIDRAQT